MMYELDDMLILSRLKGAKNLKNDAEIARFLGVDPRVIGNWRARNSVNLGKIITRCRDINLNWLLLGIDATESQNSKIESETAPKESGGSVVPAEKFMEAQDKIIKLQEEVNRLSVENVLLKRTDASTPSSTAATGTDQ